MTRLNFTRKAQRNADAFEREVKGRLLPIQIRPDVTVIIQDLPHNLTTREAERIAAIIKAMAV